MGRAGQSRHFPLGFGNGRQTHNHRETSESLSVRVAREEYMRIHVKAIFENGQLRPLQAIRLAEKQVVTVSIDDDDATAQNQTHFVLSPDLWQAFCDALD